ncbi:TPA: hypothetical protein QDB07_003583 [Burkholderia vietnamiensis]|nr:hypothetical protein [Burkholderia vietnamiensis]
MKEPILSSDELTHAARALLMAVLGAPHDIERASVTVHFDESKPGHNALNQMSLRIEAELVALLEKLCGEPVGYVEQFDLDQLKQDQVSRIFPTKETDADIPLYALNRSKA